MVENFLFRNLLLLFYFGLFQGLFLDLELYEFGHRNGKGLVVNRTYCLYSYDSRLGQKVIFSFSYAV